VTYHYATPLRSEICASTRSSSTELLFVFRRQRRTQSQWFYNYWSTGGGIYYSQWKCESISFESSVNGTQSSVGRFPVFSQRPRDCLLATTLVGRRSKEAAA